MTDTVPMAVVIPTYNRGSAIFSVLEKVHYCDPLPAEIWVHIDLTDGILERELSRRFPRVGLLTSPIRLGPGGGRHRCLLACTTPLAVSFDDDSYPVDSDFFFQVERLFSEHPQAAVFGASIWHPHEPERVRTDQVVPFPSYIGCGYAIRLSAYRQVRGYLPRRVPYGMEECDLSLQLFASGWEIYETARLRVFHNTDLTHHQSPESTSGSITNIGLYVFLNYPMTAWGWGILQLGHKIVDSIRKGRLRGICSGVIMIPIDCYRNRKYRKPIARHTLRKFLRFRRTGVPA
jgi:GT2 family glycosyltransferase